jgi:hypothetical protein
MLGPTSRVSRVSMRSVLWAYGIFAAAGVLAVTTFEVAAAAVALLGGSAALLAGQKD